MKELLQSVEVNDNLILITSSTYKSSHGEETVISKFRLKHDLTIPLLEGHPNDDVIKVEFPEIIAKKFESIFLSFPGIEEFDPNFDMIEEKMYQFECLSALVTGTLLKEHAPIILPFLKKLEERSKNIIPEKSPHVLFKGLKIGSVSTIPCHDYPSEDIEYFKKQAPYLSELFVMGFNRLLGFERLPVRGEKGGVPVHHHVPLQSHPNTGTSISFKTPVAIHGEDVHNVNFYSHFLLFAKLGNKQALTPLMTCRSFMNQIPKEDRDWIFKGMKLNYMYEPGAGRVDNTPERLISPMIDCDMDGTTFIRFSNANYHGIESGIHIFRQRPLPQEWYESKEDYDLACKTLLKLREIFQELPLRVDNSPYIYKNALEAGDLAFVSNKTGQHSRSPFEGPRYVHRMYSQFNPKVFFKPEMTASTMEERFNILSSILAKRLNKKQIAYLALSIEIDLVKLANLHKTPTSVQLEVATEFGKLASLIPLLKYSGQSPHYLLNARSIVAPLFPLLRDLYPLLLRTNHNRYKHFNESQLITLSKLAEEVTDLLSPYILELNKFNYQETLDILIEKIVNDPNQFDIACRRTKELLKNLTQPSTILH